MAENRFKISPAYLADLKRLCEPLTQEETEALILRARAGDVAAFQKAIEGNIRLVAMMARRFVSPQFTFDDCMSIGQMGLIGAVRKYDPSRGLARFSTYACRAIWWHLHNHIMRYNTAISRPRHVLQAIIDGEVDEAGTRPVISVDAGPARQQHRDTLAGDDDVVASAAHAERCEKLHAAIAGLPERYATILRMRFGFGGHHEHTLEEVGDVLGLTRERVRQLELVAIHFLRLRLLLPNAELGKTTRVIKGTKKNEPKQNRRKPRPEQRLVRVPNSPD